MIEDDETTETNETAGNAGALAKSGGKKSKSKNLRSRQVIGDGFETIPDLTTIQLRDTIISEDADAGARLFRERFKTLLDDRPAVLIWLVADAGQLRLALQDMHDHDEDLYEKFIDQAMIAEMAGGSKIHKLLTENARASFGGDYLALTAAPAADGRTYDYYGHVKPTASDGWNGGPICRMVSKVPDELDMIIRDLHEAHAELIGSGGSASGGAAAAKLASSGIIARRSKDLIG